MAPDLVRDSQAGRFINWLSDGRWLAYDDQRPGYTVPSRYLKLAPSPSPSANAPLPLATPSSKFADSGGDLTSTTTSSAVELSALVDATTSFGGREEGSARPLVANGDKIDFSPPLASRSTHTDDQTLLNVPATCEKLPSTLDLEKQGLEPALAADETSAYPFLVDWEANDVENPRNWTFGKRVFVCFLISLLTFAIYIGAAIYSSSIPDLRVQYPGSSAILVQSGITFFVLGYAVGPMLLAPMQELHAYGRNPVYIWGLAVFVLLQLPVIFGDPGMAGILAIRFLSGFVGSPALATGGATLSDMFLPSAMGVAVGSWSAGAICGPVLGPTLSGFAVMKLGWRWSFIELTIIALLAFVILIVFLPETMGDNILYRRAVRLRQLTGNGELRAACELGSKAEHTALQHLKTNLVHTLMILPEPIMAFVSIYLGLVYGVLYVWLEAFPLTFNEIHHMNLGVGSLPYLSFIVAFVPAFAFYCWYHLVHVNGRKRANPDEPVEIYLELALLAAPIGPISLLVFGWTSRESVHWIVPIIAAGCYLPFLFYTFQSTLTYISIAYSGDAVAALAANDFLRATIAGCFPLFATKFFHALGLGGGCAFLAGALLLLTGPLFAIKHYGGRLRAASRFSD